MEIFKGLIWTYVRSGTICTYFLFRKIRLSQMPGWALMHWLVLARGEEESLVVCAKHARM